MNILLLEEIHFKTNEWLESQNDIQVLKTSGLSSIKPEMIQAIITRGIGKIDQQLLSKFTNVKVVARCGVGLDNIDTDYCAKIKIPVVYAPGSNAQTTAEQTMTLLFMLQRNTFRAVKEVKEGNWKFRNEYIGDELHGKNIGILGLGNIGSKVADMCSCFGMNVSYWSRSEIPVKYVYKNLDEIAALSDIISIHLPLTEKTNHLINNDFISKCKKGVLIVNTARDQIIDSQALLQGLNTGQIGGYAADVPITPYPQNDDILINHPKTLITPHVSSLTERTFYRMCQDTLENVVQFLRTGNVLNENCIFRK